MNVRLTDPDVERDSETVDRVIRRRSTTKLLRDPGERPAPAPLAGSERDTLRDLVAACGWAPFHRRANESAHRQGTTGSVVPWRAHVMERQACLALIDRLERIASDTGDERWTRALQSKIPNMLAACGALVQLTWLPEPYEADDTPAMSHQNIEHIAAASAATQNLLLAAEARRWYAYWSSGGVLREPEVFDWLGIPLQEHLLAAVFLSPPDTAHDRAIPGSLRDERGPLEGWARWIETIEAGT